MGVCRLRSCEQDKQTNLIDVDASRAYIDSVEGFLVSGKLFVSLIDSPTDIQSDA
jgi:hypothetical protein